MIYKFHNGQRRITDFIDFPKGKKINPSKCIVCCQKSDHNYNGKGLCKYHYWIEKGRPKDGSWNNIWKEYNFLHPVRVARWKEQGIVLKDLLEAKNEI